MLLPPPKPQHQNKTSQEGNSSLTVLTVVLDRETLTLDITFFYDPVVIYQARKTPVAEPFPLQMDVPPPLPPPILSPSPPHVPPPLLPETLTLIAPPPSSYDLVVYKEDNIVVGYHQKKWKEYMEGTKT